MKISIEVPVFKGQFLQQCINSILKQTSDAWHLSLVWDGGDQLSREILENIQAEKNPNINVYFTPNQGIAKARAFLSEQNKFPYILPVDDDDELAEDAVACFIEAVQMNPWASLIRARRGFINEKSEAMEETQWFPFGPRNYFKGMVTDLFNQAQPYLIRRSAYDQTLGWRGFDDFMQAGEDCDIFLQLEEVAHFELIDKVLYHYRLHNKRASDKLTSAAAYEMWRRLADDALQRMQLPLERISDMPPFQYQAKETTPSTIKDVAFVIQDNDACIDILKELGVEPQVIDKAKADHTNLSWKMKGFKATNKKLICFIDSSVQLQNSDVLSELLQVFNETQADLLSPSKRKTQNHTIDYQNIQKKASPRPWVFGNCLLVRREVLLATGGFDEQYVPYTLHDIDFCLQAHRRNFSCFEAYIDGIEYQAPMNRTWSNADLIQLQKKWHNHPSLLESMKDLSNISGEGAR